MSEIQLSKTAKKFKLGIYEHYKKNGYQVLGVAIRSETLEELVVYKGLYGKNLTWVRPLKMFGEKVEINGNEIPRFRLIK